jgi:hypothetical protein
MKKIILGLIIGLFIAIGGSIFASGEWSDWWDLGWQSKLGFTSIKRIYDKENKLVCWIMTNSDGAGIDCQPSLELGNPLYK